MAKNELLPFADGEDANVLPTNQWEALTDILENGFQSGIAKSEQVNRVLAQGAVASYVLGQLIVDQLNKDATLDKDTLYQNIVQALQENAKDACLPLAGGSMTGSIQTKTGQTSSAVTNTTGGQLWLFESADAIYKGGFILRARSSTGEGAKDLRGQSDGVLSWGGKTVITSGGGTFTGNIVDARGSSGLIRSNTTDSMVRFYGGNDASTGANLDLYGGDNTANNGGFVLRARNSAVLKALEGKTDGSLKWGGSNVLTDATSIHVIATAGDVNAWYRVWSDGWIEQGGSANNESSSSGAITFPKAYSNWCQVLTNRTRHGMGDGYIQGIKQDSVTKTGFALSTDRWSTAGAGNVQKIYWYACGF